MKTFRNAAFVATILSLVTLTACDSAEPEPCGACEQEFITRLELRLTSGGGTAVATATDADGDGVDLLITGLTLDAGTTYTGTIVVLDQINDEDVAAEILAEADEHQFFFTAGGGLASRLAVAATDEDNNGLPIGLQFALTVSAGGAATGTLNVALSHFDEEPKNGTTRSDETDIDVTFPVTIR